MAHTKISIRNMNFFYGQKQVIHALSMDVYEHQILALLGPANSGITTLLRGMNRLCDLIVEARLEGEILLDGQDIFHPEVGVTQLRRRVAMVFDIPTPLPLTVFDNVAYGLKLQGGKSKAEIQETVERAIRMAALWDDVKDRLDESALSLSGGQQQRLCIARALALDPEVILLDRPCASLDPISTAKIEESLHTLKESYTVVIAPHSVQQAARVSDRVAFILMGELIEIAPNKEIFANPQDQRTSDYITGRFG
ncbi:MAG: phosphate ABC transporter ATP-binding protein [Symbiobacteriaceae bacterium]|nr:phosphate ABC transporter ATP-binding protein [Symbiobacteriaceae bacterium]